MLRPLLLALLFGNCVTHCWASEPLVVHEWGTFTSLQDEQGTALGRINTDDEPVPAFVHQWSDGLLFPPTAAYTSRGKGLPAGDSNVTMRLETPVLYFHLPKDQAGPLKLDVEVSFRGGWLTQYYPDAKSEISGANPNQPLPKLSSTSVGRLAWHGLCLNSEHGTLPETKEPVWLAPRAVASTPVTAGSEREQFLFYRGVGHLDAPLRVFRQSRDMLILHAQQSASTKISKLWFVEIAPGGAIAFREVAPPRATTGSRFSAEFPSSDFNQTNLGQLRQSMHRALVADGLFADEADALLNTWERSYFQNPGQRVFFMVPQSWTDAVLPLTLSVPAQVTRVMVGRIELVTPAQRDLLRRLAQVTPAEFEQLKAATAAMSKLSADPARRDAFQALAGGHGRLEDLNVPVPSVYADFLALGRFRTALILNDKTGSLSALARALEQ